MKIYWFAPIGLSLGIKNTKSKRAIPNDILESAYRAKGKIKHKQIVGLAKQLDWSERQVERWLRLRRSQDRPSTLVKFSETKRLLARNKNGRWGEKGKHSIIHMEGDIRSSSSEVSDEPSGYDPTGTNSLKLNTELYFSSYPPVYEKYTKIFVWNCVLHSASDVVFDCCAHAHIGGSGEEVGTARKRGRESTVALAVPALA
uniref:AdoMet activation domain-containing protein n=1 Tax=Timema shepardi TaxID=629360 RepID=A0A7R9AR40_TIMSH|nr:unnamed protein product [Timema shepardi]